MNTQSIDNKGDKLVELADLLESRGVRKYLNINGYGYSQIERDIVDLLSPTPVSIDKEVLEITPGDWTATNKNNPDYVDINSGPQRICSLVANEYELEGTCSVKEQMDNAKAICTAVNGTYGKNLNPAAMEELYKAARNALETLEAIRFFDKTVAPTTTEQLKTALQNSKL